MPHYAIEFKLLTYLRMEESSCHSKWKAVIVIRDELLHWINVFRISHHLEFLDEILMIESKQLVEMIRPEFGRRAGAEEVVQVDGRSGALDELQVDEFDFVTSEKKMFSYFINTVRSFLLQLQFLLYLQKLVTFDKSRMYIDKGEGCINLLSTFHKL